MSKENDAYFDPQEILDEIARDVEEAEAQQGKVQEVLGDLLDQYANIAAEYDDANSKVKDLGRALDALEYKIICQMEGLGIDKTSNRVGSFTKKVELYPQVTDMDAVVNWMLENGRTDMLQKRVSSPAFREYFESSGAYPDGIDAYAKSKLGFRRKRG